MMKTMMVIFIHFFKIFVRKLKEKKRDVVLNEEGYNMSRVSIPYILSIKEKQTRIFSRKCSKR